MEAERKELKDTHEKALLTFLIQARRGKYAKVDERFLSYERIKEQREEQHYYYDEYYYSIK